MLTHITSVCPKMTKYFHQFSPRNASFSKSENLYAFGVSLANGYSKTYSYMFWKNGFGHVFFLVCYFKFIFELKFLSVFQALENANH